MQTVEEGENKSTKHLCLGSSSMFYSVMFVSPVLSPDGTFPNCYSLPCLEQMVQAVLMPSLLLVSLCPSVCCYGSLCQPLCLATTPFLVCGTA